MSKDNNKVRVSTFPGCTTKDMRDHIKPIIRKKPDQLIIHVGTNSLRDSESPTTCSLLNKVCFPKTPCEFFNTSRCVVVTHLFTALFHGLRKHTIVCKETQKVCNEYTPLCLVITHLQLMRCKCS